MWGVRTLQQYILIFPSHPLCYCCHPFYFYYKPHNIGFIWGGGGDPKHYLLKRLKNEKYFYKIYIFHKFIIFDVLQ